MYNQLNKDIMAAMKRKDFVSTTILRTFKSNILNEAKKTKKSESEIDDKLFLLLTKRANKQVNESIEGALTKRDVANKKIEELEKELEKQKKSRETNLKMLAKYESEKTLMHGYLPKQLTEEEISVIVESVILEGQCGHFGQVISEVQKRTNGAADGGVIAKIAKSKAHLIPTKEKK